MFNPKNVQTQHRHGLAGSAKPWVMPCLNYYCPKAKPIHKLSISRTGIRLDIFLTLRYIKKGLKVRK